MAPRNATHICVLLVLSRFIRYFPFAFGRRCLLLLCQRLRRSPFSTVVRLRAEPAVRLHCFQLDSRSRADIFNEWLLFTGLWQPALTQWVQRRLKPGDTFVDVGAHHGYFSLLAAALVNDSSKHGRVVAIEACEFTFSRLRENLALNSPLEGSIRAVQMAASAQSGIIGLYRHCREPLYHTTVAGAGAGGKEAFSSVWSILKTSGALQDDAQTVDVISELAAQDVWTKSAVQASSLDQILSDEERRNARIVKVDVEGGEWSVIRGMRQLLQQCRADFELVIEVTPRWLAMQGVSARHIMKHMHELGFNAYKLSENYELSRCVPLGTQPRPCRIRLDEPFGVQQADIIFSREDSAFL